MQLDLNLLTALDALLEEGSVSGAADRLHLTAPAMSRALGRIRRAMDDEILVRTGRTMTPTPRALAVRASVHALVQQAGALLAPESEPRLASLERTFTVKMHDAVTTALGPAVLAAVRDQAPGVRLRLLAEADLDTDDLRHGRVELQIAATGPELPDVRQETVAHDHLAVAVRADRLRRSATARSEDGPRDSEQPTLPELTLEQYLAADHITVSRRGRLRDPIDALLEERGLRRTVVAAVPTVAAAMSFVRDGDVMAALPELTTRSQAERDGLRLLPIPLDVEPIPLIMAWHQRYDGDRAHAWLRGLVRAALREMCGVHDDNRASADSAANDGSAHERDDTASDDDGANDGSAHESGEGSAHARGRERSREGGHEGGHDASGEPGDSSAWPPA